MKHKSVPTQYKGKTSKGVKKFALIGNNLKSEVENRENLFALFSKSEELAAHGEYRAAAEFLAPYWENIGGQIDDEGLSEQEIARLLYMAGMLTSAIGSSEQIKDSQSIARDLLSKAARLFDEFGERDWQAKCLSKIGVTYWRNGDFPTAQIFFADSLELAVTNESKAVALLNSAMAESSESKYVSALQLYLKAYSFIGSISLLTEGSIRNGLALIYKNLGKCETGEKQIEFFDKSIIELEGALVCYDEIGNRIFALGSRINVSALYEAIEHFDIALKHLQIAKTLAYQLNDKILLAHIYENFARILLKTGNLKEAEINASASVNLLRINENSAHLANVSCLYARIIARQGRTVESRAIFDEALSIAAFIQNSGLAAACRLFALQELFSDYSENERAAIYADAKRILGDSEEKEIHDALAAIGEQIAAAEDRTDEFSPAVNVIAFESKPISIDRQLKALERSLIEEALDRVSGNQSHAAAMLGLKRQTLVARIKKDYPELLERLNKTVKTRVFPTHLIKAEISPGARLARIQLTEDFEVCAAGDFLILSLGVWRFDKIVAVSGANVTLVGFLRRATERGFTLESKNNQKIPFTEKELIIGEAIAYCRQSDFEDYSRIRAAGAFIDFPLILFN